MSFLREPSDVPGYVWIQQNVEKGSEWAALAREGHAVYHLVKEVGHGWGGYIRIDGIVYTYEKARIKFLEKERENEACI